MNFVQTPPMYFLSRMTAETRYTKMNLQTIRTSITKFAKDEDGLTIVEYAVAGGLITVAVAAMFTLLGGAVNTRITALCAAVKGATC
jgi:pilus assembly protein Flp/PilA